MPRNKKLDPRLRRLAHIPDNSPALNQERRRGAIQAAEPIDLDELVTAEQVFVPVFVILRANTIPAAFAQLNWNRLVENIYTVEVPVDVLEQLSADEEVVYIEGGHQLRPALDSSLPEIQADLLHHSATGNGSALDGAGVIVGIIDSNFDFTLDNFRHTDGSTRILFFWNQLLIPGVNEHAPRNLGDLHFPYGVEYDAPAINQALSTATPFAFIRNTNSAEQPEAGGHGTHVAGIAVGNGRSGDAAFPANRFIGVAPAADIILVQPNFSDAFGEWPGTFTDSVRVGQAISYIFRRAQQLGRPCVINISLGQNGGSHDGESVLERVIDGAVLPPGCAIVVSAGNQHIFRSHASGTLQTGEKRRLAWKVGGGLPFFSGEDRSINELEVWYASDDAFQIQLTDPAGNSTPIVAPGDELDFPLPGGESVHIDSERFTILNGDARIYVRITPPLSPTGGIAGPVSAGTWAIELAAIASQQGRFDAWIERDDVRIKQIPVPAQFSQSFFQGVDFDEQMTLSTPATGRRSVVVANYDHRVNPQQPSGSSGRGRTRDGRLKPELAAPGVTIISSNALGGRVNPAHDPTDPTSPAAIFPMRVKKTGTSMAAPHVAGIIALMFQKNPRSTAEQVRKILIAAAHPPPGSSGFDIAWGFGKVDAKSVIDLVEQLDA